MQTPLGERAYSSPDPLVGFEGPTTKGKRGRGGERGRESMPKDGEERGNWREEREGECSRDFQLF